MKELERRDPAAYEKIDRQNPRRVIRAIEVIRLTGKPFSAQKARWQASSKTPLPRFFALARAAADLRHRIDARVDQMFARGLVAETRDLLKHGLAENKTAAQALGYRQVIEHLNGKRPLDETIALVKIRTRQFAKRQLTWFRRQLPLTWLPLEPDATPQSTAEFILRTLANSIS